MKVGEYLRAELLDALAGKLNGEAKAAALDLSQRFSLSLGHVYRITAEARGAKREPRKDSGVKQITLDPAVEIFMRGLTRNADMSADTVLFVTSRHFGLGDDFMSAGAYNCWLRQERISRRLLKKDLRPYRAFESPCGNHLHHYDTTVAEAFYANDDGSIGREEKYQRYKNKPGNKRPRLILYSLIDDHSRVLFARFYFSENTLNLLDFCFRAWSQKDDKRFPFYGIPDHLYADAGAPLRSKKFTHAADKLGIDIVGTTPSHAADFGSRKHGKVERTFGEGLLGEFMKITRVFKFSSLDELNSCLWEWLIHLNNKKHSVTRAVRFGRWLASVGTPRSMPSEEMFALLHYDRAERVVSKNMQVQLNGKIFQLPYRKPFINWCEAKIECYWYPGHEEKISVVYDNHEEEIAALAPVIDIALEYKKIETTEREKKLEALKEQKYSAVNFPAIWTPENQLPYLPRKGEAFDESKIAEKKIAAADGWRPSHAPERWFTRIESIIELQRRDFFQKPPSPGDLAWLAGVMSGREKIAQTELDAAVATATGQMERMAEGGDE